LIRRKVAPTGAVERVGYGFDQFVRLGIDGVVHNQVVAWRSQRGVATDVSSGLGSTAYAMR
jgi:hypothetical protein